MKTTFRLLVCGAVLSTLGLGSVQAQTDTVRTTTPAAAPAPTTTRDPLYRLGRRPFTDTVSRSEYISQSAGLTQIDDCDTTQQAFLLLRRPSPWRLGVFAGPNFAYCGTWENTFGPNPRDNSLYNGAGFNVTFNADYFFSRPERAFRFGVGAALGYQNYFTRSAYRDFLLDVAASRGFSANQVEIRQRPSEDMFLTVGPVINLRLARSRRNWGGTFLEAAVRGGIFRTEAATIAAFVPSANNALIRQVNISNRLNHFGGLASLGVYFPISRSMHLGIQGQGFYTGLNYFIVDGLDDLLLEYERKHGGFNVGLGLRKSFMQNRLIAKAPVTCPTCDSIPALAVRYNGAPLIGQSLEYKSLPQDSLPVITWQSRTIDAQNETFTARMYYLPDSANAQEVLIAQTDTSVATSLDFPTEYVREGRPAPGFYRVSVHNRQNTQCGVCVSEAATTSFAILGKDEVAPCVFRHRLERLEVFYRDPRVREVKVRCYCPGEEPRIVDTVSRVLRTTRVERLNAIPFEFDSTQLILNLQRLPNGFTDLLTAEKQRIESRPGVRFNGRRYRPQVLNYRAVFSVDQICPEGSTTPGTTTLGRFTATISNDTYSLTDLKPLTDEQYQRLIAPPAPAPTRTRRR
jgi:hypothetical protein